MTVLRKIRSLARRCKDRSLEVYERGLFQMGRVPAGMTIVTGADSSHFNSLLQLLASLRRYEPTSDIVVYDLGLTEAERCLLRAMYPLVDCRVFDYRRWPAYVNIKVNAGEYAWKPIIIADLMDECRGRLLWLDAGCAITQPLYRIRNVLARVGLYTPHSCATVGAMTHPSTLAYMSANEEMLARRQVAGTVVAVDHGVPEARQLIRRWKELALVKECIAPTGSDRSNHRQDQAVLSVLVYQSSFADRMPTGYLGFKTHQDIDGPAMPAPLQEAS